MDFLSFRRLDDNSVVSAAYGAVCDIDSMQKEMSAWSSDVNHRQKSVDSQMKIDDARTKLACVNLATSCDRALELYFEPQDI